MNEMTLNEIAVVAGAGFTGTVVGGLAGGVVGDVYGMQAGATFGGAVGSVIPGFGTLGGALIGGALGRKYGGLAGSLAGAYILGGFQDQGWSFFSPDLTRLRFEDVWEISDILDRLQQ